MTGFELVSPGWLAGLKLPGGICVSRDSVGDGVSGGALKTR